MGLLDKSKLSVGAACLVVGAIAGLAIEYGRNLNDTEKYADSAVGQLSVKMDTTFLRKDTFESSVATIRADSETLRVELKGEVAVLSAKVDGNNATVQAQLASIVASLESLTRRMDNAVPAGAR